jgi:hypothetical protein
MRVDAYDMDVYSALEYLDELIDQGIEFPDALYKASKKFKVDYKALQDAYDGTY